MGGGLQLHLRGRDPHEEAATEAAGDPCWTRCEQHNSDPDELNFNWSLGLLFVTFRYEQRIFTERLEYL